MRPLRVWFRFLRHLVVQSAIAVRRGRLPVPAADLLPLLVAFYREFVLQKKPAAPLLRPLPPRGVGGPRRVLFISHNLNLEGAPIFLLLLVSGIDGRRYESVALSLLDGPLRARYVAAEVPVLINGRLSEPFLLSDDSDVASYHKALDEMARWARRSEIDLIFCNTLQAFWGVSLAQRLGVPSIWSIHESVDWRQYFDEYPEAVAREAHACLRLADRLVFASDGTRRLFSDLDGAGRVRTIHYGIDVAAIDEFKRVHSAAAVRAALGLSPEDRVVSVVGTTCERKGQMDFVQAVMKLRSAHPRLRGYVVGARPGAYLRGLEDLIRRHDLAFVTLVPETKDVFQYYRATDVFVCSSYEESFPVVNLEAMAFGLPIVSTDVFGIPEAITDGHDGLLVKPGGVDSLAAAIGRVLGDPGLARRLGEAAYATVTTRFTRQHMVDDYEEVFADCLAPR